MSSLDHRWQNIADYAVAVYMCTEVIFQIYWHRKQALLRDEIWLVQAMKICCSLTQPAHINLGTVIFRFIEFLLTVFVHKLWS